jgi:hypothetical protein
VRVGKICIVHAVAFNCVIGKRALPVVQLISPVATATATVDGPVRASPSLTLFNRNVVPKSNIAVLCVGLAQN